jgi:hypothetical protein
MTSVTLTATPATGATYIWSAGATPVSGTNTATVTAAGIYTVTVTDSANGCTASATIAAAGVTVPPVVGTPSITQPTCADPTGTITVTASGSGSLEYSVDGGTSYQGSPVFSELFPGSYNISVRFASYPSCVASYPGNSVELSEPIGCCAAVLAVDASPIAVGLYEASELITSTGVVATGLPVTFNAPTVELLPGFEVLVGGELTVIMTGCNP